MGLRHELPHDGFDELRGSVLNTAEALFQLVADLHEVSDLGKDPSLLSERGDRYHNALEQASVVARPCSSTDIAHNL